jgi:hypothetical protein
LTGAILAAAAAPTAASGSGAGIAAMAWGNVSARGIGATNTQTFSGFTGSINISATVTGGATLSYYKNSGGGGLGAKLYTGPFAVNPGDTLAWQLSIPGSSGVSGTVTVDYNGASLIDTFSYVLTWP